MIEDEVTYADGYFIYKLIDYKVDWCFIASAYRWHDFSINSFHGISCVTHQREKYINLDIKMP